MNIPCILQVESTRYCKYEGLIYQVCRHSFSSTVVNSKGYRTDLSNKTLGSFEYFVK